jgi:LuxR family maltose regulon positive regulatory protein
MNAHPATLAKLTRPHLAGILPRERLFNDLDQGREKSIVWIAGPPGSGKTTLVADYLDTWAPECVWYQVDPGDADVATFFYYMSQALPDFDKSQSALPLFSPEFQNNLPTFTRLYFRELFARLTPPFALVFDNYQEVPDQSRLHEVLREGMEEIPAGGCVIIISRRDPPTSMARLRANQRMEVIDSDALRLIRTESDSLVKLRGHELPESALQQLYDKTRGWAAGLVLLLSHNDNEASLAELPGDMTPQVVFDYLAGEIFEYLDAETRDLLIKTAWLRQFTAKMAGDLSCQKNSEDILEQLTKQDYFVTKLRGGPQSVYQYHPLLQEFLLKRADESLSARERTTLQSRAATLLEESGQIEDTVALRVASRSWPELIRIIRENAETMLQQGRGETLEQWLEALPTSRLEREPWMLFWLASCRLPFAPRESRRLFDQAYELFFNQGNRDLEGLFSALAGAMYAIMNELDDLTLLDRWIDEALTLTEAYPDFDSPAVEAQVTCYTFMSLVVRQPWHPDIETWGERTAALAISSTLDPKQLAEVTLILAAATTWTGRFQSAEIALQSLRTLAGHPEVPLVVKATLYNVETMYAMMTGDYEGCMSAMRAGLELADTTGLRLWQNRTLIFGIGGALIVGDLEMAEELAEQLDQPVLARRRFDSCMFHYFSGWKAMLEDDVLLAYRELRTAQRMSKEIGLPFFELLCSLSLAQVLFTSGDTMKGRRYLRQVRTLGVRIKNRWLEFTSLLVFAQIALDQGRRRSSLNSLRYALSVGREKGYTHTIWWQPAAMARLCVVALEEGIEVDYVRSLVQKRNLVPDQPPLNVEGWPWRFRIYALGRFELAGADGATLLSGRVQGRPIELLKITIALGGRAVSVDRITDVMWPNIDRDYAHRSFNTTLHRLRKLLGEDAAITLTSNQISLSERFFWVDTWALDQNLGKLRLAMRRNLDPIKIGELADQTIELYQGAFMPGDEDNAWVVSPREQLRNKFLRFINDFGHWLEQDEKQEKAIEFYYRGLEVDDLAEGIYRRLILCFEQLGRHAEAIDTYNRCCKTLKSQLDVEPAQETRDLYETIHLSASAAGSASH